jgi:tetratricopeptide (TPR) repeat protein
LILLFSVFGLSTLISQAQVINLSGQQYLDELQPTKAKKYFQEKLIKHPDDLPSLIGLGKSYLALQLPDSAKELFRKVLDMDPNNPYALIGLGQIAWLNNDPKSESTFFERARRSDKTNPMVYCAIAESCLNLHKQDTVTALVYLKQGLDLHPKYARLHYMMGNLESAKKNYGSAVNAFHRALFFDPNSAYAYRNLGRILLQARSFKEALEAFNKSIALYPEQIQIYKNLGDLYYSVAKYADAEQAYQLYMEKAEITDDDKEQLAFTLFFNKKYKEAERVLEQLLQVSNEESILLRIKGYIAFETGEYKKGVEYMTIFFQTHNPKKLIALDYSYYSKLLQKTGNEPQAMENLKKAIQLEPSKLEYYEELAKLANKNKLHREAASCYKKMLELGSDKLVTNFLMAKEYFFEGESWRFRLDSLLKLPIAGQILQTDSQHVKMSMTLYYSKADSAFSAINQLNPEYAGGYIWKGRIQSILDPEALTSGAKDAYQKALTILEKSDSEKNKKSILECYKYLGSYYYLGYERSFKTDKQNSAMMRSKSIECFKKIRELDPEDKQAIEVLNEMKIK